MHKFPVSMSLGTGGLSSEVDNIHSLGSKHLMGKLLVLRRRKQGRAVGQASGWCEGDPQVEEPYGSAVFPTSPSLGPQGRKVQEWRE